MPAACASANVDPLVDAAFGTVENAQRSTCVYIRQSISDQLVHNLESQRR
jgi:hypothetical protein